MFINNDLCLLSYLCLCIFEVVRDIEYNMVYDGIWYMVYGIWYMVYGIWYMVYNSKS